MTVFIIEYGFVGEEGSIFGVYSTENKAKEVLENEGLEMDYDFAQIYEYEVE